MFGPMLMVQLVLKVVELVLNKQPVVEGSYGTEIASLGTAGNGAPTSLYVSG